MALFLTFEERLSDQPLIERVWRCWSGAGGRFASVATTNLEIVVARLPGESVVTIRGPETRASVADCPPRGAWTAIRFRPGVHIPALPTWLLADRKDVHLPVGADGRFLFLGRRWETPSFDNAEVFVARLVRAGALAFDDAVAATLADASRPLTARSVQRRFLRATGMTYSHLRQVHRARAAALRLSGGAPIMDVVFDSGYYDQAHLTRSLRRFIGVTPAIVSRAEQQLSFLYKTEPASLP